MATQEIQFRDDGRSDLAAAAKRTQRAREPLKHGNGIFTVLMKMEIYTHTHACTHKKINYTA